MNRAVVALAFAFVYATAAQGANVKILTAGAMKAVVLELVPQFEKETGHKAVVDNDTAGGLAKRGEAELGLHQISEILPVKGVKLVGPLPAEIQNYTTYAVAIGAEATQPDAARALIRLLTGPAAEGVLKARGMERPPS